MNTGKFLRALVLAGLLGLGSIAGAQAPVPPAAAAPADYLVQPGDTLTFSYHFDIPDPAKPYIVEPGDKLYLYFRYSPELSRLYPNAEDDHVSVLSGENLVQPDGTLVIKGLTAPLKVDDKTTTEIAKMLFTACAGLLENPEVVVSVEPQYEKQKRLKELFQMMEERPVSMLTLPVPPDGILSLPLVPELEARGKSVRTIGRELTERYHALGYPRVTVTPWVEKARGRVVRVLGKVDRQGSYPLTGDGDLWSVLGDAGGLSEGADSSRVRIIRPGETDGPRTYSLKDYMASGDEALNPRLKGGELIYVPSMAEYMAEMQREQLRKRAAAANDQATTPAANAQ